MEIHKANPFMMDDHPAPPVLQGNPFAAVSNPFLSQMAPITTTTAASNPFLSASIIDVQAKDMSPPEYTISKNPFADFQDHREEEQEEDFPPPPPAAQQQTVQDGLAWLTSGGAMQNDVVSPYEMSAPVHELDDLLGHGESEDDLNAEITETVAFPPPVTSPISPHQKPAPPPRPTNRPHDTHQLILSVTGAMQATSDHLLDRLRAAAPSPIPGHHSMFQPSHSPSPSPSPCPSPDLLHQESAPMDLLHQHPVEPLVYQNSVPVVLDLLHQDPEPVTFDLIQQNQEPATFNLLNQNIEPAAFNLKQSDPEPAAFDLLGQNTEPLAFNLIHQDPTPARASPNLISSPVRSPVKAPASPSRPPPPRPPPARAAPPAKPAPPKIDAGLGFASIFGSEPLVETTHQEPVAKHQEPEEEVDLFGPPKPKTRTKDDILKLYEKKEEKQKDLLAEDLFGDNAFLVDLSQQHATVLAPVTNNTAPTTSASDMASLDAPLFEVVATDSTAQSVVSNEGAVLFEAVINEPTEPAQTEFELPVSQNGGAGQFVDFAPAPAAAPQPLDSMARVEDHDEDFDAFSSRFESVGRDDCLIVDSDPFDPFSATGSAKGSSVWGTGTATPASLGGDVASFGFGADGFDSFLALTEPPLPPPPPHGSPRLHQQLSKDSDEEEPEFALSIKPRCEESTESKVATQLAPALAPPPRIPIYTNSSPANPVNPFLEAEEPVPVTNYEPYVPARMTQLPRSDSQETPPTPLFDEDQTVPLEVFPRTQYSGQTWEMQLRQPNKKKITSNRFWKKVFVKLHHNSDNVPAIQLFSNKDDKDPFQELQLQPCYSVSDISAQQFDHYGKIFTVKVQYVFYKERPGIRPGQVTKAERLTSRLQQFAAYAIQGDYAGVKEFGSDLRKLGIPVEHAPHISELLKLGTQNYEELKQFSSAIEEALFRITSNRDRAQSYKTDEVQMTAVDEFYVEQDKAGRVLRQIARVRVFLLAFLSGMPDVELGVNDLPRQGKEVVGRHDIIPVITEEWIRLEDVEFHSCVDASEFDKTRTVKFRPPDACYVELLRFRVRPPKNRELPLQVRTTFCVSGQKVELRSDVLVPGYISHKYGQIPCEDVAIRFPIPESWIYLFRVEKHFRYGSVKSAHRRTGKIKGIERFLGAMETAEPSLIEVSSGAAKYEHQHRSIVWRMSRLPKEGQGSYTTHTFVCRINLAAHDQVPENLARHCHVEFTMPATNVSHTTLRSLAVTSGDPPEKYVRYLARHEYLVEIEHTSGQGPAAYVAATSVDKPTVQQVMATVDSDSDSD